MCHTHDDVGWLKTVDQYYVGSNNTIQHAGVEYILDSVIDQLINNPNLRFEYVEQAFFTRWWRQQDARRQQDVRNLIRGGQLSFINGGFCMHDEAATHYRALLDQTAYGHRTLHELFNYPVRVGWQIDPFGHSSTQASLLSADAGFEALYFARMDYQDRQLRYNKSDLEFVWRANPSLGDQSQVFTGQFIAGHYEAPKGFCFDLLCADPVFQVCSSSLSSLSSLSLFTFFFCTFVHLPLALPNLASSLSSLSPLSLFSLSLSYVYTYTYLYTII